MVAVVNYKIKSLFRLLRFKHIFFYLLKHIVFIKLPFLIETMILKKQELICQSISLFFKAIKFKHSNAFVILFVTNKELFKYLDSFIKCINLVVTN